MKTYYVVALMQAPGFKGKLPFLYNATYKSKDKASMTKKVLEDNNPTFKYVIVPLDLPVHPGDTLDFNEKETA